MNQERKQALYQFYLDLDRSDFMDDHKRMAHHDTALPISHNQTISQPSLVHQMTELLDLEEDSHVLEIGTGSGYQTAFLSTFSHDVVTVERITDLHERAIERMKELGYENITFILGDGSYGCPDYAPFDRIMVTAASSSIPPELVEQLKIGGIMVIPVGNSYVQELLKVQKMDDDQMKVHVASMVRFVPLVGKYGI